MDCASFTEGEIMMEGDKVIIDSEVWYIHGVDDYGGFFGMDRENKILEIKICKSPPVLREKTTEVT